MFSPSFAVQSLLAVLLISTAISPAQPEQVRIPACFYAFDYATGHETVFCMTNAGEESEIILSRANIVGPIHTVMTDGVIQLHAHGEPDANGEPTRIPVASARVPNGIDRALIVLLPNAPDAPTPYRAIAFDHNHRAFPLGTYRILNLSAFPVRGAIGSQRVAVQPGQKADLALRGQPGSVVPVRFEYFENESWALLTETRSAVREDRRWLLCLYRDPANGRFNMRSIPDRTLPPQSGN